MAKKKDVLLVLNELKAQMRPRNVDGRIAVEEAVANDQEIVYAGSSPLKYAGKVYNRGDKIKLGGGKWDTQLLEQRKFMTVEGYKTNLSANIDKTLYYNNIQPSEVKVLKLRTDLRKSNNEVAAAQAKYDEVKNHNDRISNNLADAEAELRAILEN